MVTCTCFVSLSCSSSVLIYGLFSDSLSGFLDSLFFKLFGCFCVLGLKRELILHFGESIYFSIFFIFFAILGGGGGLVLNIFFNFAVNQTNWLQLGALNAKFGATRSIHGSGISHVLLLIFCFLNLPCTIFCTSFLLLKCNCCNIYAVAAYYRFILKYFLGILCG
jgi:hypothetical protein